MKADNQADAANAALATFAGTWNVRGLNEAGDSIVGYQIVATADTSGWTVILPGRDPIPLRVSVDGDSVTTDAGPYESVLRPGVQVTTHAIARVVDGKLVGHTVARYATAAADSVVQIRMDGTKAP